MKKMTGSGIFIVLMVVGIIVFSNIPSVNPKTRKGVSYIQNAEKSSVEEVETTLKYKREAELTQAIQAGKLDVFTLFDDFAFLGDSRVMGYISYGFLPAERVYANAGDTIYSVDRSLDTLQKLKPTNIYFSYGINDTLSDIGNREGGYDLIFENAT